MAKRKIPRGDFEFAQKLVNFSRTISRDPARFTLTTGDAETIAEMSMRLSTAVQNARHPSTKSPRATREKDAVRREAEPLYKRFLDRVRVSETVDSEARSVVGLATREEPRRSRTVPQSPPDLRFVKALHADSSAPIHELRFRSDASNKSKPDGAVRLELFVDLVGSEEAVPVRPGDNYGGRPWYLRSFSRSPIRITPPMSRTPMLVVYWGRWADATGNVGPWSATVKSRFEGHSPHVCLGEGPIGPRVPVLEGPARVSRPEHYSVAVRDAQYEYFNSTDVTPAPSAMLEAKDDAAAPQLEGPAVKNAA